LSEIDLTVTITPVLFNRHIAPPLYNQYHNSIKVQEREAHNPDLPQSLISGTSWLTPFPPPSPLLIDYLFSVPSTTRLKIYEEVREGM
jgi:hypothetical protein